MPEFNAHKYTLLCLRLSSDCAMQDALMIIYFVIKGFCIDRADVPMPNGVLGELPSSLLPGTGNA
jgi:hypothetical protein